MNHVYETAFTKEQIELIHHVDMKNKLYRPLKILEAMLWGVECKIEDMRYRLAESENGGWVFVSIQGSDEEHILGHPELTLTGFTEMINTRMSDEEFEKITAHAGFSKVLVSSRKTRRKIGEVE